MEPSGPKEAANATLRRSRSFGGPAPHLDLLDFDQEDQEQKTGSEDPQHQDDDESEGSILFAKHDEQEICVTGAAATKTPRRGSKSLNASLSSSRRLSSIAKKSPSFAGQKTDRRRSTCGNNNDEDAAIKKQWKSEVERLREDAARWKRELEHVRDEKSEIEEAFRRLDREIANGYNLTERKEKELKIAELMTKNQKIAQLLEKELKIQGELRASNAQLLSQNQSQKEQLDLLNSVLSTLETKHSSLTDVHATLKTNFDAAQLTVEKLQESVNEMQTRFIRSGNQKQRFQEYEHKIQVWERKYLELERKFTDRDQKVHVLTQEIESLLENRASLEKEVGSAHDQVIRMKAMMKTLEAKIEANLQSEQARADVEKLRERIRMLEGELFQKSCAYADLSQSFDEFLSDATRRKSSSKAIGGRSSSSTQTGSSRLKAMASRVAALTEKLQFAEDLRERKARSLDVLMQAFPYLLQQLDALQDKFLAAAESNEILKNALEQMQQQTPLESNFDEATPPLSSEMYLRLAREKYLLSAPYQIDLLTGYTGAMAFTDHPSHNAATVTVNAQQKVKKFPPFRVVSMVKSSDNNQGDDGDGSGDKEDSVVLVIIADANDANGVSYLNRSKINAFLQFTQGKAAKKKFKEIIFTKIAEFITKLREIKSQFAVESTAQRATIQMLQREVEELKHKLKSSPASGTREALDAGTNSKNSVLSLSRRKLLMKLIDLYVEKQQQHHHQSTFLTQTTSSDVLISNALTLEPYDRDTLDISDCSIEDDDLSEVLLKVNVSGVIFHEIRLDANALSDTGAQHLANFFEKCPSGVKIVSVDGNSAIMYHGIEALKRGLLRNPSVHRIEVDPSGRVVDALAAQDEYETLGRPAVVLRVFLPKMNHSSVKLHPNHASEEDIDRMMDRIHQMGFSDLFARKTTPPAAFSIYSAAAGENRKKREPPSRGRLLSASSTTFAASRRQAAARTQQEQKFHRLEAAIKRATTSTSATTPSHSRARSTTSRSRSTARMQTTPRYPLGTRVSKYFPGYKEPFAGVVDDYSTFSHFYHITYEDGDSEEMTEADLHVHVIHMPTAPAVCAVEPAKSKKTLILNLNDKAPGVNTSSKSGASSPTSNTSRNSQNQQQPRATSPSNRSSGFGERSDSSPEEMNKLIGLGISKLFVDDAGRESIVNGTVSSYFIATRKYRVLFFNGHCEDLSYQDVIESIPLSSPNEEESKKRKLADSAAASAPSASPKKPKTYEGSNGGNAAESSAKKSKEGKDRKSDLENLGELSPPFDSTQGLTKTYAHNITRSVLYVVVSTSSDASSDGKKEVQLDILANGDLKPKKALKQFVGEGGLATLQELLSLWTESKETETGLLVILKILAVLPGVTTESVVTSKIGKMLNKIWKQAISWGFDDSISELASWIIKKWKNELLSKDDKQSSSSKESSKLSNGDKPAQKEKREEKSGSKSQKEPSSQAKNARNNGAETAQKKRSNSVNHLRDLMGSRGGRSRDVLGSALGSTSKRLGPAYAHRARRSTVVLDSVVRRVTENEKIAEATIAEKAVAEEEEIERNSRIRFAEPTVLEFLKDVEVSKLLAVWGPMGKKAMSVVKPASSSSRPLKSILRVRLERVQPVYSEPDSLVAPPVVQTVSISGRHLDLSNSRVSFNGEAKLLTTMHSSQKLPPPPEDEVELPDKLFAGVREQTNRSPPPDFEIRSSLDEGSVLSSPRDTGEVEEIEDDDQEPKNGLVDEKQHQPVPLPPAMTEEPDQHSLSSRMEQKAAIVVE